MFTKISGNVTFDLKSLHFIFFCYIALRAWDIALRAQKCTKVKFMSPENFFWLNVLNFTSWFILWITIFKSRCKKPRLSRSCGSKVMSNPNPNPNLNPNDNRRWNLWVRENFFGLVFWTLKVIWYCNKLFSGHVAKNRASLGLVVQKLCLTLILTLILTLMITGGEIYDSRKNFLR